MAVSWRIVDLGKLDSQQKYDCSICFKAPKGSMVSHESNQITHIFHKKCLKPWVCPKQEPKLTSCPNCRKNIEPGECFTKSFYYSTKINKSSSAQIGLAFLTSVVAFGLTHRYLNDQYLLHKCALSILGISVVVFRQYIDSRFAKTAPGAMAFTASLVPAVIGMFNAFEKIPQEFKVFAEIGFGLAIPASLVLLVVCVDHFAKSSIEKLKQM